MNDSLNLNDGFDKLVMQTEEIKRINEKGSLKNLERFKFVKEFHMKEDNENIIILYSNHHGDSHSDYWRLLSILAHSFNFVIFSFSQLYLIKNIIMSL